MKILVCMKQVPDMESKFKIADILVVADLKQFLPVLTEKLRVA